MPLHGTRGAASALGFGFAGGGKSTPDPWTYTQTNSSIGSSTVNYGKDFGSNANPKGTLVQYNGIQSTVTTNGIYIPQLNQWKSYNLNYFVGGTAQPILNSNGWTNNLYTGNSSNNTSCFDALLNTKDIQYGSYIGNGLASRTIAHSLQTWAGVLMCMSDGYYTGGFRLNRISNTLAIHNGGGTFSGSFFSDDAATLSGQTISSWSTASTFRVPDACNVNGRTYYYIAYANSGTTVYCGTYNEGASTQNIGFEAGTIVTKGSGGGNYVWHNPYPVTTNSSSSLYYYNSFFVENNVTGQQTSSASWSINSTGFTSPNLSNSWYANGAGNVYYLAIKKQS